MVGWKFSWEDCFDNVWKATKSTLRLSTMIKFKNICVYAHHLNLAEVAALCPGCGAFDWSER